MALRTCSMNGMCGGEAGCACYVFLVATVGMLQLFLDDILLSKGVVVVFFFFCCCCCGCDMSQRPKKIKDAPPSLLLLGWGKDLDAIFDLVDYEDSCIVEIEVGDRRNTWQFVGKVVWKKRPTLRF